VLARMRRGYTREGYAGKIRRLREFVPDISVSTDVIVGFPGETERDFQHTLDLIEEIGFDAVYSFVYSPRPGTPSAEWDDGVTSGEKAQRLSRVQRLQERIQVAHNAAWIGREVDVLAEGPAKFGRGLMTGRTVHGQIVNFPAEGRRAGDIVPVRVEEAGPYSLKGRPGGAVS